ncbi:septum formation initiator family protein [Thermodesulfobacteriota bacterium]
MGLNKKDFLKVSLFTLLVVCLIVVWLAFGERGFIHLYRMEKERQAYLEKIRKLEEANKELLEQIGKLRKDKEYIEAVARRELGLVRENELIYRFSKEQNEEIETDRRKRSFDND